MRKNKSAHLLFYLSIVLICNSCSTNKDFNHSKSLLVEQLKNTHSNQNWFIPVMPAIEGISAEQANWKDDSKNHSIAELVSHLVFWNERVLNVFKGKNVPDFKEDNAVTFQKYSEEDWKSLQKKIGLLQTEWILLTENASQEQMVRWGSEINNMASHMAYHTGQIIYIRKMNGWWK